MKPKTRPLAVVLREAWKIRDELDRAAIKASGRKVRSGDERIRRAAETVTAMLYFKQTHKWEGMLGAVLDALDPDLYRIYEERSAKDAYDAAHGTEDE